MILRLLNIQGVVGIAAGLALLALLVVQKVETRHWRKQSGQFEQLYRDQESAFARTVADYRGAAEAARATDRAAAERVRAEQRTIDERTSNDFEARLAAARDRAQRLQPGERPSAADRCARGATDMSGLSPTPCESAQAARQDRLPDPDRLAATEQAIQLDELIKWVGRQHAIDPNTSTSERH